MARIALVKVFTGLNLGVHQLAADLRRSGHESLICYFKDYVAVPLSEAHKYQVTDYAGVNFFARGELWNWNCYKPVTEQEYALLLRALRDFDPHAVGFSLTSGTMQVGAEVSSRVREELGVPIIWGGVGPTLEPERSLDHADVVCVNEGEETIVDIADRLDRGEDLSAVAGTWSRTRDGIAKNAARPLLDLEKIAIPDFRPGLAVHIEDDKCDRDFAPMSLRHQYIIMTSRGCPFSCSFCVESVYQDLFGKKNSLRRRSVDLVIEELVQAKERLDVTSVMFYDDVFTTHRKWLKEFAPKYKAEVGLPFWCYTYPTTTRKEDIALLAEAGCVSMTMGIQSGSQRILDEYFERPTPVSQAIESAKIITSFGIECWVDLITKVEFETEADVRATFRLLASLPPGAKTNGCGYMTRFPGYSYTDRVEKDRATFSLTDEDYAYHHKLYLLATLDIPRGTKLAIAADPLYRKHPDLLDRYLLEHLDFLFIKDYGPKSDSSSAFLELSTAQATVPLEYRKRLAPSAPADAPRPEKKPQPTDVRSHLPVLRS